MRTTAFIPILIFALLICGCDPIGLRRVQLQLRNPNIETGNTLSVDSADTQEALKILDGVAVRHGFSLDNVESGYIRVYSLSQSPTTIEGHTYPRITPCHVKLTCTGLFVTFGYGGLLGGQLEAQSLFVDVRDAFIKTYGKKNVKARQWGMP